jgi:hypothetical protein
MDSTYFLNITNEEPAERTEAFAFGDLTEVSFIARRRIVDMVGSAEQYSVTLVEITPDNIGVLDNANQVPGTGVKRTVTSFQGDGDTAAVVLKRKLAAERKQQAANEQAFGGDPEPQKD